MTSITSRSSSLIQTAHHRLVGDRSHFSYKHSQDQLAGDFFYVRSTLMWQECSSDLTVDQVCAHSQEAGRRPYSLLRIGDAANWHNNNEFPNIARDSTIVVKSYRAPRAGRFIHMLPILAVLTIAILTIARAQTLHAQATTEAVTRDPQALSILQSSLSAMKAADSAPAIADFIVGGTVSQWNKQSVNATFSHKGIGTGYRYTEIQIPGQPAIRSLLASTTSSSADPTGAMQAVPIEAAMDGSPYFFLPLLIQATQDSSVDVRYVARSVTSPSSDHVRITIHQPYWHEAMGAFASATFDVYFRPDNSLVERISNRPRSATNLQSRIPHSLLFNDYRAESGWLVPHQVQERYLGVISNVLSVNSVSLNTGQSTATFALQ